MIPICFVIEIPKHTSGTVASVPSKSAGNKGYLRNSLSCHWIDKKTLKSLVNQKVKKLFESQGTLAPVKKITMAAGFAET